jgi:hypothetical protein
MARRYTPRCYRCSRSEETQDLRVTAITREGYEVYIGFFCNRCRHFFSHPYRERDIAVYKRLPGYDKAYREFITSDHRPTISLIHH